ncbi:MAG TPA: gliding motility protein GldC [Brumimicrobium sp.]|nr:gliding motility protein GldC [Brumimicrobium sp.]
MNEDKIVKTSEISIKVGTNENNVPVRMKWSAEDGGVENAEAKAMFLSLWDGEEESSMRIDLWVKELSVDEMKVFFHQSLVAMADTFERATGEKAIVEDLRDYCFHFAEKMNIMPEED